MAEKKKDLGGKHCLTTVAPTLIFSEPCPLPENKIEKLWQIFAQIGEHWKDVYNESKNLKSAWLEMIKVKTEQQPSYSAEYNNAILIIEELIQLYGEQNAYQQLFFSYKIPHSQPEKDTEKPQPILTTLLAHAKYYVVDEFIRMQVLSGGFKHFGGQSNESGEVIKVKGVNYKGFVKGSRYRNENLVRTFAPKTKC
jgi:hypothetical protein